MTPAVEGAAMNDKIPPARFIDGPSNPLAVITRDGGGPGLFWLGGYASDMRGTKAEAIDDFADDNGLAYTRFDYSGHGESGGDFEEGTIRSWAEDAAFVLEHETQGPQILIGSSMGGWVACLLNEWMPEKIAGMVMVNPAPDFASELTPHQMTVEQWETIQRDGRIEVPGDYGFVMVYTKKLFDEGAKTRVLDKPLKVECPVRILSGMEDDVVPTEHVLRMIRHMEGEDICLTLIKHGDHRLSKPSEIALLLDTIGAMTG